MPPPEIFVDGENRLVVADGCGVGDARDLVIQQQLQNLSGLRVFEKNDQHVMPDLQIEILDRDHA